MKYPGIWMSCEKRKVIIINVPQIIRTIGHKPYTDIDTTLLTCVCVALCQPKTIQTNFIHVHPENVFSLIKFEDKRLHITFCCCCCTFLFWAGGEREHCAILHGLTIANPSTHNNMFQMVFYKLLRRLLSAAMPYCLHIIWPFLNKIYCQLLI